MGIILYVPLVEGPVPTRAGGGDGVRCNSFLTEVNAVGQLRDRSQVARTVLVSAVIQRVLWVQLDGTASARFDALEKTVDLAKVVKI